MDYRQLFSDFMDVFRHTNMYHQMEQTSESSSWHREENVAVHTEMVVAEYLKTVSNVWSKDDYKGALACAFHDVGKPAARTEKTSPERGTYYRYTGHEQISVRLFEHYISKHWDWMCNGLVPDDIYAIGWTIQNHLPYRTTKKRKLENMRHTIDFCYDDPKTFERAVMADQLGRIADTHQENLVAVRDWFTDLWAIDISESVTEWNADQPTLTVLVGASSSGKSTLVTSIQAKSEIDVEVFSWDRCRLEWYTEPEADWDSPEQRYTRAFELACDDSEFKNKVNAEFIRLLKTGESIVVDNMNLTDKSRVFFCQEARKRGYAVVCALLPIDKDTLAKRSVSRDDRAIPTGHVINMYNKITYPTIGHDVNAVIICETNIEDEPRT